MLSSTGPRRNNVEATLDGHDRRQDHLNKRQVARLRREKSSVPVFGIVRWFIDSVTDLSEAEITDSSRNRLASPTLVWIDFIQSMRPVRVGNVVYRLELVSSKVTRSGTTRDLYRAVADVGVAATGAATYAVPITATYATTGNYATVGFTTTINSVAGANQFIVNNPFNPAAVGATFDLGAYKWGFNSGFPALIPEWITRRRANWSSATTSIDFGEPFDVDFAVSMEKASTGEFAHMQARLVVYYDGSGNRKVRLRSNDLGELFARTTASAVTSVNFSASTTTSATFVATAAFTRAFSFSTASTEILANSSPVALGNLTDSSASNIATVNFAFTMDATTKRLTAASITVTGVSSGWANTGLNYMVFGGREDNWPWYA